MKHLKTETVTKVNYAGLEQELSQVVWPNYDMRYDVNFAYDKLYRQYNTQLINILNTSY